MIDLRRVVALLESATRDFEAGDMYAHHARRPVEKALQELKQLQKQQEKENGNRVSENRA